MFILYACAQWFECEEMVAVTKGCVFSSDPQMIQFLLYLDEIGTLGKFVEHKIDDRHLFIKKDTVPKLEKEISQLMDRISVNFGITDEDVEADKKRT